MTRYIDADKIEIKCRGGINEDGLLYIPIVDVYKSIDNTPTADVQEIKHGHWKPWWALGFEAYKCSVCGYHNTAKAIKSGTENYCCNCGAIMDEEADDD